MLKLILTINFAGVAASSLLPKAVVTVRTHSETPNRVVTVGSVGEVSCADSGIASLIESAEICVAPPAGASRKITREQVLNAIRRSGVPDSQYDLDFPQSATVTTKVSYVTGKALVEAARRFVECNYRVEADMVIEPSRVPADKVVPIGELELRPRAPGGRVRAGANTIPVDILVDGVLHSTCYLSINVRTFGSVLVAKRAIARGERIGADNLELRACETTRIAEDVCRCMPQDAVVARLPIAAGEMIRKSCVSPLPVIRSGDTVTVTAGSSLVCVSDKGLAASDGCVGETISIRMSSDNRTVRATVTGPGQAKITFIGGKQQ